MAIPTYEKLLRPILALANGRNITRKDVTPAIVEIFKLTPEDQQTRIATGATKISNRCGWAMTFLTKGGLIEKVSPRVYSITPRGKEFLEAVS